jgi:hypothetical protein
VKFNVGSDLYEQIFMVPPQLTIEMIIGANCVSDCDVILDHGEKYLTMKQDKDIRRHEFFYNIVPKIGSEIKLIVKRDRLTQQVHKMSVRNRQGPLSNVCFRCADKIQPKLSRQTSSFCS